MTETGHEPTRGLRLGDEVAGECVPPAVIRRWGAVTPRDRTCEELPGALGDTEKARTTTEDTGGECALQRVRRAEKGEPRRDGGRREAVVREGDQHRFEHPQLARRRSPHRDQPEGELAEADLTHQLAGEVVAQQGDGVLVRGADRRRVVAHRGTLRRTCRRSRVGDYQAICAAIVGSTRTTPARFVSGTGTYLTKSPVCGATNIIPLPA